MAYNGGIQFMDIPFGDVGWNTKLRFNKKHKFPFFKKVQEGNHALITDVGRFRNCSLEQNGTDFTILDSRKAKIGWIRYDVEASEDLHAKQCVVVGREPGKQEDYILVVRPTSVDGVYMRVGVRWIESGYTARQKLNAQVV
jgi:hypothetical protein